MSKGTGQFSKGLRQMGNNHMGGIDNLSHYPPLILEASGTALWTVNLPSP